MKATLTIGTSRITADLSNEYLDDVLDAFFKQIDDQLAGTHDAPLPAPAQPDTADPALQTACMPHGEYSQTHPPGYASTGPAHVHYGVMLYKCPHCSRSNFRKLSQKIEIGDTIACECGHNIKVFDVRVASGGCPKCKNQFWDVHMINRLDTITCKKCRHTIVLVATGKDTLGTR